MNSSHWDGEISNIVRPPNVVYNLQAFVPLVLQGGVVYTKSHLVT